MKRDIFLYKDIIDIIQSYVDDYSKEFGDAKFKVSLLQDFGHKDRRYDAILLTISHLQSSFSEVVFPRQDMNYGYESIESVMSSLYNRTM